MVHGWRYTPLAGPIAHFNDDLAPSERHSNERDSLDVQAVENRFAGTLRNASARDRGNAVFVHRF